MSSRRFHARAMLGLTVLALAAALGGCGQGQYTREHTAAAQEKLAMLKSGTEWQMAQQQFLAGDLEKSLKTVDRSIALNPRVTKSHSLRGRILMERGRLEEARNSFLEAEKLDATFVDAQYYLGIIHERVGQPSDALVRYTNAMNLDSSNAQYVVAAAEMLVAQSQLDQASALLESRRQYLQYNPAIRQTLGHIAMLRNDVPTAANFFREALLLAPGDQAISEDLVQAHMSLGQFADAESILNRLLTKDTNKDRRDLKHLLARCLIALERPADARTVLQELASSPEGSADVRAWVDLGNVAAILQDHSTLRQASQRVATMAPQRHEGFMLRAMLARQTNQLPQALAFAEQAVSRAGKDASPFVLKAIIQQDLGRTSEAQQTLALAQQVDPRNPQVIALLRGVNTPVFATHPAAGE